MMENRMPVGIEFLRKCLTRRKAEFITQYPFPEFVHQAKIAARFNSQEQLSV